jgi:RHS repeat-associated protein
MARAPSTETASPPGRGDQQDSGGGGSPPSLPKGGGAIRGIGEKFSVNPVTGTASLDVPIETSRGRGEFGPELTLSYDSGNGNGPFGFGWRLSLPAVTRKTDKGLPRYADAEDSDVFMLAGGDDLVPAFKLDADGNVVVGADGRPEIDDDVIDGHDVLRYRPRIEGMYSRIERWTNRDDGRVHWRSYSKDNRLTVYGKDKSSQIVDGDDPGRVFSWLICETRDDRGNGIVYEYKAEDGSGIDLTQPHERNRGERDDLRRATNRYLKRVRYGNRVPLLDAAGTRPHRLTEARLAGAKWMFEVVLDYGEHDTDDPQPSGDPATSNSVEWLVRDDPFSTYRSGFEVRTARLCRRVLMFHHFPDEADVGADCLVRSADFAYESQPIASFISGITQTGYKRSAAGSYLRRSLPPLEFEYSRAVIDEEVRELDSGSLENLPIGADGSGYRWVDLDAEGLSGVLTQQAGAWLFKRNLGDGLLGPAEEITPEPSLAASAWAGKQLLDLDGDGRLEVVQLGGTSPGYYERTKERSWEPFRTFEGLPAIGWADPNLRFVDLDGSGNADVLITENDVITWHASAAKAGFAEAQRTFPALDEETGARVVFADGEQSVYVADMSGDGLADLVRIRNGEVCYWPNLGYGRFGAKVTMDDSPWFDHPEAFAQSRVRLADIDGSGTSDIVYLGRGGVRIYFNQSGNGWSPPRELKGFPQIDNTAAVATADLLGNGTGCLVWSSPLPGNGRRQLRYIDLMGGQKPHLLVRMDNNLGMETRVTYAPSTKFYLEDQRNGRPWLTRLPFPVQVIERVEIYDHLSRNRFVTRYAYHHGYFDGFEREFRGFAMVEQRDAESFTALSEADSLPLGDNVDLASQIPPVLTKTWFHTGAHAGRDHISDSFAGLLDAHDRGEYYREPAWADDDAEARERLLEDTVLPTGLTPAEEREACRALKGSMLRQEVYALDGTPKEEHPYTVIEQNFTVRALQPQAANRHGVFCAHPRETLTYRYERDPADPRVSHKLTLEHDQFGNVLKTVEVAYGRRQPDPDLTLQADHDVQGRPLISYTEHEFTRLVSSQGSYRPPLPCETKVWEITGLTPAGGASRFSFADWTGGGFALFAGLGEIGYEEAPDLTKGQKRLVDLARTLYRSNDLTALLPLETAESMALPGEVYKLAFTPALLDQIFQRPRSGQPPEKLLPVPADVLDGQGGDRGGYVQGQALKSAGLFTASDPGGNWWIPGGRTFHSPDAGHSAAQELAYACKHFFLTNRKRDPFGRTVTDTYDDYDLLLLKTRDPVGNVTSAAERDAAGNLAPGGLDYRVLVPRLIMDANRNRKQGAYDALGMLVATAVQGHDATAGDTLAGFVADLSEAQVLAFGSGAGPAASAANLLKSASTRIVYDIDRFRRTRAANPGDPAKWQPAMTTTLARETHASDPAPAGGLRIQINVAYSDGFGRQVQKKAQAEPGPVVAGGPVVSSRWVGSGWTIYSNKGNPVREYEQFFSDTWEFEFARAEGVSTVKFYDPVERVVAILHPNHTFEKVLFGAWRQTNYDLNDTVAAKGLQTGDPRTDHDIGGYVAEYFRTQPSGWQTWYGLRAAGGLGAAEQDAAQKAAAHADTPTTVHLDPLGRPFLNVADNGPDGQGGRQLLRTRTYLDIESNQREVRDAVKQQGDALGRVVLRFAYDMLGNRVQQVHMDAGARWMLNDAAGKRIRAWDSQARTVRSERDELRRPLRSFVTGADPANPGSELLCERLVYGECHPQAESLNLRNKLFMHLDHAGVVRNEEDDFKGNLVRVSRRFAFDYKLAIDWRVVDAALPASAETTLDLAAFEAAAAPLLEAETFTSRTTYDAMNRAVQVIAPRSDQPGARRNVTQLRFNEANLLEAVQLWLDLPSDPSGLIDPGATPPSAAGVSNIDYDAKGRRLLIEYANGASTRYAYEPDTHRLSEVYTRRGASFTGDCDNASPPPDTVAAPATPPPGVACGLQNLHYFYDPVGNITRLRDDAQQAVFFRNKRVDPSVDYTYDPSYRLVGAEGREHLGQVGGAPPPYSSSDQPRVGIPWSANDGDAMARYSEEFDYDEVGNLLAVRHRGTDPVAAGWSRTYTYAQPSAIEDGTGGLPAKTGSRLSSSAVGSATEAYSHDAHGNVVRMPHLSAGAPNIHWDYLDRLRQTDHGTGGTAFNVYDAAGQRVRKVWEKAAGVVEERLYLGGFEVFRRRDGAGSLTLERETLHVVDGKRRVAMVETRTSAVAPDPGDPVELVRYQLANHIGSVGLELDDQARIVSYEEYSPYGSTTYQAVRSQTAPSKRYRFSGAEREENSGLAYHGARFYAPWLGRWLSTDPDEKELMVGSAYAYSRANPVVLNDPAGRSPVTEAPAVADPTGVQVVGFDKTSIAPILQHDPDGTGTVSYRTLFTATGNVTGGADIPTQFSLPSRLFRGTGDTGLVIRTTGAAHGIGLSTAVRGDHFQQFSSQYGRPTGFTLSIYHETTNAQIQAGVPFAQTAIGEHVEAAANRVGLTIADYEGGHFPVTGTPAGVYAVAGTFRAMTTGERVTSLVRTVASGARSWGGSFKTAALSTFVPGYDELRMIGAGGSALAGAQYLLTTHIPYAAGAATASVVTATTTAFAAPTLGAIGAAGAGPVAVAGAAVVAAGAAGYGVGTVINKYVAEPLIDKAAPGSGPLGDWYYRTFLK